uniref:Uncharacterized protein TCIL3000_11_16850 n=1 Tax=Trypanosoma congolense (strain IL3000) TaxID=1068625 RepID=G0V3E8_TRYCI|nr:unnamed protein product [Trypanosoma congolense IL3000]
MPARSARRSNSEVATPLSALFASRAPAQDQKPGGGAIKSSTRDASCNLSRLRQRLLEEVRLGKGTSAQGRKMYQAHREWALEVAFGRPNSDEVEVSTMEFSLICPYSRVAICYPVRSKCCRHMQCCDLESWIVLFTKQRSMRDPSASCPVCRNHILASSLEVDTWQLRIILQMPQGTHKIVLNADGSYSSGDVPRNQRKEEVIDILGMSQAPDADGLSQPVAISSSNTPTDTRSFDAGLRRIKRERHSSERSAGSPSSNPTLSSFTTHEEDDVVVQYESLGAATRVLPSQARLWVAHCPKCKQLMAGNDEGVTPGRCDACGTDESEWSLVRRFPNASVTLELTGDETTILRGVDALSPYLSRAGFTREVFADISSSDQQGDGAGVWYTTLRLTRYELDFLEACCERVSRQEAVDDIPLVPPLFRLPRRRRLDKTMNLTPADVAHE